MDSFIKKLKQQYPFKFLARRKPVPVKLDHKILVGTHHKTGTVWLLAIFQKICRELGLRFSHRQDGQPVVLSQTESVRYHDVLFHEQNRFDLNNPQSHYKGIHLIRDPRDIIVSGCFYHQKSHEEWLHLKREPFEGMSYQEKINSYDALDDQILFEMEHSAKNNIERMLAWDYENPHFLEVKYEDLILDHDLVLFHRIFTFLGFPGTNIPDILRIAYDNSLFSGKVRNDTHIRSGKSQQWVRYFKPIHKRRFLELFGDALIRLGYESDDRWVDDLEEKPQTLKS